MGSGESISAFGALTSAVELGVSSYEDRWLLILGRDDRDQAVLG